MSDGQKKEPLSLDVQFKNLGKISEANIRLRPFTVIAGCNGSGKSFVTKSLYSIFFASNDIDIERIIDNLKKVITNNIKIIHKNYNDYGDGSLDSILRSGNEISKNLDLKNKEFNRDKIIKTLNQTKIKIIEIKLIAKDVESNDNPIASIMSNVFKNSLGEIKEAINDDIEEILSFLLNSQEKVNEILTDGMNISIADNFMTASLQQLVRAGSSSANINIKNYGVFSFDSSGMKFDNRNVYKAIRLNSHPPVYLESPIYWKITDALADAREEQHATARKRNLEGNQIVSQVPKYVFDLLKLLEVQVKTEIFNDIAQTIEKAINGNLSFNDGNIQFSDNASNATVGLNLTALGVTNLGMIALLLKRGAILPGTFLFIDEPEVHLHPSWQVIFIQVLHELSKRGVNVVIASHSIDIMKAIENIMDSDEEVDPQTHFGINQLTKDGNSVDDSENNFKRLAAIQKDLGTPFYEMFLDQKA